MVSFCTSDGQMITSIDSVTSLIDTDNIAFSVSAAVYSLAGTAKLNGIDPELYLLYVLARIDKLAPRVVADRPRTANLQSIRCGCLAYSTT